MRRDRTVDIVPRRLCLKRLRGVTPDHSEDTVINHCLEDMALLHSSGTVDLAHVRIIQSFKNERIVAVGDHLAMKLRKIGCIIALTIRRDKAR
jgi:hypothetical protein